MNNFNYNSFTKLIYSSYLHCHRIKVLSSHTSSAIGVSYLNILTRSSDWIFNPMCCTDSKYFTMKKCWISRAIKDIIYYIYITEKKIYIDIYYNQIPAKTNYAGVFLVMTWIVVALEFEFSREFSSSSGIWRQFKKNIKTYFRQA